MTEMSYRERGQFGAQARAVAWRTIWPLRAIRSADFVAPSISNIAITALPTIITPIDAQNHMRGVCF